MAKQPAKKEKAPATGKEVAQQSVKEMILVQDQVPDHIKRGGPARGSEGVKAEDLVIPRLEMVQALSPVVKEGDPAYNASARPGMLINTVTKQLYGKEAFIVPVQYTKQWLVWKKRKDPKTGKALEGGFLGAFSTPEEANDKMQAEVKGGLNADHVEVIDTPQHLCLLVDVMGDGQVSEVMLSMPRTKAKISRQWNSMIKLAGGDRFARVYRVTTSLEKGKLGDYYNFAIAQSGFPAQSLYQRAEKLYEAVTQGGRVYRADVSDVNGETEVDQTAEM